MFFNFFHKRKSFIKFQIGLFLLVKVMSNKTTIMNLSEDELIEIFEYCSFHYWLNFSKVNHFWYNLLNDQRVTRNLFIFSYGREKTNVYSTLKMKQKKNSLKTILNFTNIFFQQLNILHKTKNLSKRME